MNYEAQRDFINETNSFMRLCGVKITWVGPDEAQAELTVTPQVHNPSGRLHGGAYYTMADAAASAAARTDGFIWTTVDGSVHYHRAAEEGVVRAAARVRHRGRTLCTAAVELTDGTGRLLADGTFTMFRVKENDHPAFQAERP